MPKMGFPGSGSKTSAVHRHSRNGDHTCFPTIFELSRTVAMPLDDFQRKLACGRYLIILYNTFWHREACKIRRARPRNIAWAPLVRFPWICSRCSVCNSALRQIPFFVGVPHQLLCSEEINFSYSEDVGAYTMLET